MGSYAYAPFPYVAPPELRGAAPRRHAVAVIGAGPVGLAAAIDLAQRDVPVVLLDESDVVSVGSRAICWSKRTLEIFDRLGVGERMVSKGVTWQVGRVFHGDRELYSFDLLPEGGHKMPAFINLQQYYVEEYLVDRARDFPGLIDLRWKNEVVDVSPSPTGVRLRVRTPDGEYRLDADWVIAADGARSPTRARLGLAFPGQVFEERFLIADVRSDAEFPNERLFWFEPTFHPGQSALLHRQPDNVYRIDFQLGPEADPELERQPGRVVPRVQAAFGPQRSFELEWCSVYAFRCARMERFVHGRVIFAGDSAHVVSPFGARGGNGGIQDVDNLGWKLALVVKGEAPATLLDSYDAERGYGADENIMHSSRTTNFMTPKSATEKAFRDAVLALAPDHAFARALLNAGRLSTPCNLAGFSLQQPAIARPGVQPGAVAPDAPIRDGAGRPGWLLNRLGGAGFTLLLFAEAEDQARAVRGGAGTPPGLSVVIVTERPLAVPGAIVLVDTQGLAGRRYGASPGEAFLIRPDQHVAARFAAFDAEALSTATRRLGAGMERAA